jgi:hypothetical protein
MEAMMQMTNRIEAGVSEIQLKSPADYSAMKEKLIREARVAQAAAIGPRLHNRSQRSPPSQRG